MPGAKLTDERAISILRDRASFANSLAQATADDRNVRLTEAMDEAGRDHLRAVSRVYGPETWEVYDLLDQSLDPRGPEAMLALAADRLTPASRVLDVGCRDASHLIELVRTSGATGVGLDPVNRLAERARTAVGEAGLTERIEIVEAPMQN